MYEMGLSAFLLTWYIGDRTSHKHRGQSGNNTHSVCLQTIHNSQSK